MTLDQLKAEIKRIGWDGQHVNLGDERYIRALNELQPLRWNSFPGNREREIGIQLEKTGSGKVIAIDLATDYRTAPLDTPRAALGRLRANLSAAKVLDRVFPQS